MLRGPNSYQFIILIFSIFLACDIFFGSANGAFPSVFRRAGVWDWSSGIHNVRLNPEVRAPPMCRHFFLRRFDASSFFNAEWALSKLPPFYSDQVLPCVIISLVQQVEPHLCIFGRPNRKSSRCEGMERGSEGAWPRALWSVGVRRTRGVVEVRRQKKIWRENISINIGERWWSDFFPEFLMMRYLPFVCIRDFLITSIRCERLLLMTFWLNVSKSKNDFFRNENHHENCRIWCPFEIAPNLLRIVFIPPREKLVGDLHDQNSLIPLLGDIFSNI